MPPRTEQEPGLPEPRRALYAGSFDPPTNGHLWVIEQGSALFDELHVVAAVNPAKQTMFSVEERLQMLADAAAPFPNVTVGYIAKALLADYAYANGYRFLLRGLRSTDDFAMEKAMNRGNFDIKDSIRSVYVMCPPDKEHISSSFVKGLIGYDRWEEVAAKFVPAFVLQALIRHHAGAGRAPDA